MRETVVAVAVYVSSYNRCHARPRAAPSHDGTRQPGRFNMRNKAAISAMCPRTVLMSSQLGPAKSCSPFCLVLTNLRLLCRSTEDSLMQDVMFWSQYPIKRVEAYLLGCFMCKRAGSHLISVVGFPVRRCPSLVCLPMSSKI